MTPISFTVSLVSTEPIYRQILEQLRRRVAAGRWTAGQELPSVRCIAKQLAVHPMTVSKAYQMAEREGLLERRRGKPMTIATSPLPSAAPPDPAEQLRPVLMRAASEANDLGIDGPQALRLFSEALGLGQTAQRGPC